MSIRVIEGKINGSSNEFVEYRNDERGISYVAQSTGTTWAVYVVPHTPDRYTNMLACYTDNDARSRAVKDAQDAAGQSVMHPHISNR